MIDFIFSDLLSVIFINVIEGRNKRGDGIISSTFDTTYSYGYEILLGEDLISPAPDHMEDWRSCEPR